MAPPGDDHPDFEGCRAALEGSGDFRVLRRVTNSPFVFPDDGAAALMVAVVDVETTGLDVECDAIIELAIRRVRISRDGRRFGLGEARNWLEDPDIPLSQEVARLTGLSDQALAGKRLDDRIATAVLRSSDLIVAHNASFDRRFIERRLPDASGLPWACTCNDLPWASLGYEGRSLSHLLCQLGFFFEGHRAGVDVDAVIELLGVAVADGKRVFEHLVDAAERETFRFDAVDAPFDARTALRQRGYRWSQNMRCWRREVPTAAAEGEARWLTSVVYGGRPGFSAVRITWRERHG